jgi:DNA-directed RNA polymerase sigma subunit (sigma70/sigma32)
MNAPMTFKEIGKELGVSEQRAKQICQRALDKLRKNFPATLTVMMEEIDERESMRRG